MKRLTMETTVGLFVAVGIAAMAYLSIKLGKLEVIGDRGETYLAEFTTVGGLKNGSVVEIAAMAYLSIKLGKLEVIGDRGETYLAEFGTVGGLKNGSVVEIAGVEVGRVKGISLNDYRAVVKMSINPGVKLQDDSIVSIRTKGLIGEKYVRITPGSSDKQVAPGAKLRDTEDPVDIETLISNYVFGKI